MIESQLGTEPRYAAGLAETRRDHVFDRRAARRPLTIRHAGREEQIK